MTAVMMKKENSKSYVKLKRLITTDDVTVGAIYIDNVFQCFTLEDTYHEHKILGKTRIPAGTYSIVRRHYGRKYEQYKKRFPELPEGIIQLIGVPDFTDILIHIGNYPKDTSGCILVGNAVRKRRGTLMLVDSTKAYKDLFPKLYNYAGYSPLPNIMIED